jgi:hypothetical protein
LVERIGQIHLIEIPGVQLMRAVSSPRKAAATFTIILAVVFVGSSQRGRTRAQEQPERSNEVVFVDCHGNLKVVKGRAAPTAAVAVAPVHRRRWAVPPPTSEVRRQALHLEAGWVPGTVESVVQSAVVGGCQARKRGHWHRRQRRLL